MFSFFKRRPSASDAIAFEAEWRRLRDRYADPAIELATTRQALVVSAASVLDRIWNANGGAGWSESCEEDYIQPLREHLPSSEVFSPAVCAEIHAKLDTIVVVGRRNLQIPEDKEDATYESDAGAVNYVVRRTVEWCRHFTEPIPLGPEEEYRGHF